MNPGATLLIGIGLVVLGGGTARQTLPAVLERAGAFAVECGAELSDVVADEEYTQQLVMAQSGRVFETRALRSEIAFVTLSGGTDWLAFREVLTVDGKPVADGRGRLEDIFRRSPASALGQVRAIVEESARHNLGPVHRNFNTPTPVMQLLHPSQQSRFRFSRKGEETIAGRRAWIIEFRERQRPTFIRTPAGGDLVAEGHVWVVPEDGTVLRTELVLRDFVPPRRYRRGNTSVPLHSRAEIVVSWRHDDRLDAWVPAEMRESYVGPWMIDRPGVEDDRFYRITGWATYANYRRFGVDIRIRDPQ